MSGIFEVKEHLASENYLRLHPRDYYGRYVNARILCMKNKEATVEILAAREAAEDHLGCTINQAVMLLGSATDLAQFWIYELGPMATRTMTVYEALCILDSFRERLDCVIMENFLPIGGGYDE